MESIATRIDEIHRRIEQAARRVGRDPGEIELMAVSKTFPVDAIREAVENGQRLFGENRVQEALAKIPELPSSIRWHLIGPLQSNKVRKILPHVEVIQSLDSLELAHQLNRIARELGLSAKVYLEVNLGKEQSKHGFSKEAVEPILENLLGMDRLDVLGLMSIPPFAAQPEGARRYFAELRELRDRLAKVTGVVLPGLSMGMSHDFEVAVEEGSTLVRVGSAIFGRR